MQHLSVIVFPGGFNLPLWAAQRQGFFEENGVRVTVTPTPSSTFQMQGLAEGRFDIAMTAFDNVVAYQEGQGEAPIPAGTELVAFLGSDNGFLSVMGGKGVQRFSDLKGKKLSVDALTTGFAFVLRELLAKNGVAESDVTFERDGGLVERFPKLLDGSRAATVVLTPFDLIAQAKGHVQLARAAEHLGAYMGVVAAARRSWVKDNRAAVAAFTKGFQQGVGFAYENRDIAEALLVANMKAMTPALARKSLDVFLHPDTGFFKNAEVDVEGARNVLALRSKFTGRTLTDTGKYT